MKKIINIVLCAIITTMLCACENEGNIETTTASTPLITEESSSNTEPTESEETGYFSDFTDEELIALGREEFDEIYKSVTINAFRFGGFPVDYNVTYETEDKFYVLVEPEYATSKQELRNKVLEYVTEDFAKENYFIDYIDTQFTEIDGQLYVTDAGKGGDPSYMGYEISKIMNVEGDKVNFKIDYTYADPETGENEEVESYDFELVYEDGKVKVNALTWPD